MDKKISKEKIDELRILEGNFQNLAAQKQALNAEISEVENAINEVDSSEGDIYKVTSGIMFKSKKESVMKELREKKRMLDSQFVSIEKQQKLLEKNSEELKSEIRK
ncbi:prefoldin subunit [Candidatus Pacearchaeota archaeon]|nr:prefoldin subunit [Candidatus Pacearchaeota archaeon]